MATAAVFKALDTVVLIASLLTALRLLQSGLSKRYPVLTVYLMFMAPYLAGPLTLDLKSRLYYDFWLASEPLLWMLQILLVRELCGGVLAQYEGIRTMGRRVIYGGMVVSISISLLSLLPDIKSALSQRSRILATFAGMARGINLALALFLLIMLFLVSRYPIRLSRNVLLNTGVFTLFFICNSLNALLSSVFDLKLGLKAAVLLSTISCGCAIVWLLFLTPAGEKVENHWPRFSPEYEKHLLDQLAALNRALGGSKDKGKPGS